MGKHAYLILAHKVDLNLRTLLEMVDYPDNDIYLHMDLKNIDYQFDDLKQLVKHSRFFEVPRVNVQWGTYSLVQAELNCLKEALRQSDYDYLHFLSGQDLSLKSQAKIHEFFDQQQGKEFVQFESEFFSYADRVKYYYPLQTNLKGATLNKLVNRLVVRAQKILHLTRNRDVVFQKGAQWVSVTSDLAKYLVAQEENIFRIFRYSLCPDELFIQTLVENSEFKTKLYSQDYNDNQEANMRHIDWERGFPYTFGAGDFEELKHSNLLFARKFDSSVDDEIILRLKDYILEPA